MLKLLLIIYALYMLAMYVGQRSIIFPGRHRSADPEPRTLPSVTRLFIPCSFGEVETWVLPPHLTPDQSRAPAVIFTHGNGELIDDWDAPFSDLARRGVGVMLLEFPGYGRSEGTPSKAHIEEAVTRAYDTLVKRPDVDASRVVAMGRSIGGRAATILATKRPVAALVLMSTFTSLRPFLISRGLPPLLLDDDMDNLSAVRTYGGPLLVLHGKQDRLIPFTHGQQLALEGGGKLLSDALGSHNNTPTSWGTFFDQLTEFLRDHNLHARPGQALPSP